MRLAFLASMLLLFSAGLKAQNPSGWAGAGLEVNLMSGKMLRHTPKFTGPIPERTTALELNFVRQTDGRKAWQQRRQYPLWGMGVTYTNYGIDSVYGHCIAVYPNMQFPIIRTKSVEWTLRMGMGLGYVTRYYGRLPGWDTQNNAIGGHLNNFTVAHTDLRFHLNEHVDLQAGAYLSHMSNGAFRQPNLGINVYGASVGVRYFPVTSRPSRDYEPAERLPGRWLGGLRLGLSMNESGYADGPVYPVYMVTAYAGRRWHGHNRAMLGIDYSYHAKLEAFQRNNEINPGRERANSWRSAVVLGNEFVYGRFGLLVQLGVYVRKGNLRVDPFYEKLGIVAYLMQDAKGPIRDLTLNGIVKAHREVAELAELGVGLGF